MHSSGRSSHLPAGRGRRRGRRPAGASLPSLHPEPHRSDSTEAEDEDGEGTWGGLASVANESEWHVAYRAALAIANGTKPLRWLTTYERLAYLADRGGEARKATVRPVVLSRCAKGIALHPSHHSQPAPLTRPLLTAGPPPPPTAARLVAKGNDFGCAEAEGLSATACEFECSQSSCVDAYDACLAHIQCLGVYINETDASTRATLKTYVLVSDREAQPIVLNEADWRQQFLPRGRQKRHQAQPGLLPSADDRI